MKRGGKFNGGGGNLDNLTVFGLYVYWQTCHFVTELFVFLYREIFTISK